MAYTPGVATSNKVIARDRFGEFIRAIDVGQENMMKDISRDGAKLSRELAPKGHKVDPRTPTISGSITASHTATTASWGSSARHALPQETGWREHQITGNVSFFWEKEGRMWNRGHNMINSPANSGHPYLRPAYVIVMARWMDYARKHMPR